MLNIILAALPLLGKLIPEGKTKEVLDIGTKVAQEVFGTTDEAAIVAKMEADPKLAEQFKAKLEAQTAALREDTERYRVQVEDAKSAREANLQLASLGHAGYWSGPIIDTIVVTGFFGVLFMLIFRPITLDQTQFAVLNILLGALTTAFIQIINYHRGSSAGSAQKDGVIGQLKQTLLNK